MRLLTADLPTSPFSIPSARMKTLQISTACADLASGRMLQWFCPSLGGGAEWGDDAHREREGLGQG